MLENFHCFASAILKDTYVIIHKYCEGFIQRKIRAYGIHVRLFCLIMVLLICINDQSTDFSCLKSKLCLCKYLWYVFNVGKTLDIN